QFRSVEAWPLPLDSPTSRAMALEPQVKTEHVERTLPRTFTKAASGLTGCGSSGPTAKPPTPKLLSKPYRHGSPSHKFSSPSHTRRPRHGCGPASFETLSSNNV